MSLFLLIFCANILMSVSLVIIAQSCLVLISWWLCDYTCITLSYRRTHIKEADSERTSPLGHCIVCGTGAHVTMCGRSLGATAGSSLRGYALQGGQPPSIVSTCMAPQVCTCSVLSRHALRPTPCLPLFRLPCGSTLIHALSFIVVPVTGLSNRSFN